MQRQLEVLRRDLAWFIEQDDRLALVISALNDEVAYVLKCLEMIEARDSGDVFLVFAHEAKDASSYVSDMVTQVRAQRQQANQLRAERGLPPWPDLPSACGSPELAPARRVIALIEWVRARLPAGGDHRIALGLLPAVIREPQSFVDLLLELLPGRELLPWMPGVRLMVRDDRAQRYLIRALDRHRSSPWIAIHESIDLTPGALVRGLVDEAKDPELPQERRMTALLQLAALDYSHRRYEESFRKWGVLFEYYASQNIPSMQAVALCGAADVLRMVGQFPEAKTKYRQGLALAKGVEGLPAALNLLFGAGQTCLAQEEWEEAEGYLDLADKVASRTLLAPPKCEIMERLGLALLGSGKTNDAIRKWRAAADLSLELGLADRYESLLRHLVAVFRAKGMRDDQQRHERELADAQRVPKHGHRSSSTENAAP